MPNDGTEHRASTRRACLKWGGAVAGGGLLAGCTGDGSGGRDASRAADSPESYTVSMAPVGEVSFTGVPQDVMVYSLLYADMAVAYGHGDAVNSLGFDAEAGGKTLDAHYERLDGVSFDWEGLTQLNTGSGRLTIDKELFYELDSDLHLVDPCLVRSFDGWGASDIETIRTNIGPWFGNTYSRAHGQPPEGCRDEYQYYTLWDIAERVARVFQAQSTFAALDAVHDELVDTIQSKLPPAAERPTVGSVLFMEDSFYPSKVNTPGFANAHIRPLGVADAFAADDVTYETAYDHETMLDIDPDVILHRYGIASYYDVGSIRETLADHPVASQLTAVQNGRVYPSGHPVQGPVMNLFQLEMTAKQLFPDIFGEWPDYTYGDPYPEIPPDERLFDRQRVADIINGDF